MRLVSGICETIHGEKVFITPDEFAVIPDQI